MLISQDEKCTVCGLEEWSLVQLDEMALVWEKEAITVLNFSTGQLFPIKFGTGAQNASLWITGLKLPCFWTLSSVLGHFNCLSVNMSFNRSWFCGEFTHFDSQQESLAILLGRCLGRCLYNHIVSKLLLQLLRLYKYLAY